MGTYYVGCTHPRSGECIILRYNFKVFNEKVQTFSPEILLLARYNAYSAGQCVFRFIIPKTAIQCTIVLYSVL